jgi:DNA modification methylase
VGDVKGVWITGDTLDVCQKWPTGSVDLIVTSPPFLALRSYLPDNMPGKEHEIGQEGTPEAFLDVMLLLVDEWWRILAPHGTLCIELGDSYSYGDPGWSQRKSAALIPEALRWAMAYGRSPFNGNECSRWLIRNTVTWVRKNPAPGAVGDKYRPATSDMVIACKRPDRYFDVFPVRKPLGRKAGEDVDLRGGPPLDWWEMSNRNTQDGHFATFPPELVVRPVLSMSPPAVCVACGRPVRRVTDTINAVGKRLLTRSHKASADPRDTVHEHQGSINDSPASAIVQHVGWETCECDVGYRPGVVMDPFAGSGTVLQVATGHGRIGLGVDLDPRNVELARASVGPLLFEDYTDEYQKGTDWVAYTNQFVIDPSEIGGIGPTEGGVDASEEGSEEGCQEASEQGSLYEEGDG